MSMVEIAGEHGDGEKVRYWLTAAAQEGNIGAMRELILDHDEPAEQAWVWTHLSRLLNHDLSRDLYEAINDGTPYDDDSGGPAYVGGKEASNRTQYRAMPPRARRPGSSSLVSTRSLITSDGGPTDAGECRRRWLVAI